MRLYHHSQREEYRYPFGAVEIGTEIRLEISAFDVPQDCRVLLRLWTETNGESFLPMDRETSGGCEVRFTCVLHAPEIPQLLWYSFQVLQEDRCYYYGNNAENLGGEGEIYPGIPPSFQITVYRPWEIPQWYWEAVVYQIFPDRFCRGDDWLKRTADSQRPVSWKGPRHILRQDWSDSPYYEKNKLGEVTHWDFFGGTLNGIREKINLLESFGIRALYLNPIFEAASNHRYDTANYLKIDPRLGDEASFKALCREAREHGISVILDGVFNHTGSDSVYFDRFGNYGGQGAWSNPASPYADWYRFTNGERTEYESWWGVADLPGVEETSPSYQDFIYQGNDSVIRRWMKLGARGWRLDVADELPDSFIRSLKQAVVETDREGVLLGEVWEDASHKVSYGKMRPYFFGDELDGVMSYPLRELFLNFFTGKQGAEFLLRGVMSLYENYPRPAFYAGLNLIGSHDRARVLTLLGTGMKSEYCTEEAQGKLSPAQRKTATERLRLLILLQMTFPGVPCIYYGDEAGLEGGTDPNNRAPYPWGAEDEIIQGIYKTAISLRREWPVFTNGDFIPFRQGEDVFGFIRCDETDKIAVVVNRCPYHGETVSVDSGGSSALELLSARCLEAHNGKIMAELPAMGAAVLRLGKKMIRAEHPARGAGILCHITSLPSEWGMGQFGKQAENFVEKLAEAGQRFWQILPLNPTDSYRSPYAGPSAFAGNELLIDPGDLVRRNLLREESAQMAKQEIQAGKDGFSRAAQIKMKLLKEAFDGFTPDADYAMFSRENAFWLEDYCQFRALKERFGEIPWQEWPEEYRWHSHGARKDPALEQKAAFFRFCQYIFDCQWKKLKAFANGRGIQIIGDLPFYVSEDSADVWSQPQYFRLNESGRKTAAAGVPPDYFAADGQNWENPIYRWDYMKKDGYRWWINRLKQAVDRYHFVRLDHFRGFERFWEIPAGEKSSAGSWKYGPGWELFVRAQKEIHTLPILAEDLGEITVPVRNLVFACGFYGMDVFQFSAEERLKDTRYRAKEGAILYSGTHDNQTLKGWCEDHWPGQEYGKLADEVINALYSSDAPVVILPMQDVLGLGDNARMNTPGVAEGNWRWQFSKEDFTAQRAAWLRKLTERSGRLPSQEPKSKII